MRKLLIRFAIIILIFKQLEAADIQKNAQIKFGDDPSNVGSYDKETLLRSPFFQQAPDFREASEQNRDFNFNPAKVLNPLSYKKTFDQWYALLRILFSHQTDQIKKATIARMLRSFDRNALQNNLILSNYLQTNELTKLIADHLLATLSDDEKNTPESEKVTIHFIDGKEAKYKRTVIQSSGMIRNMMADIISEDEVVLPDITSSEFEVLYPMMKLYEESKRDTKFSTREARGAITVLQKQQPQTKMLGILRSGNFLLLAPHFLRAIGAPVLNLIVAKSLQDPFYLDTLSMSADLITILERIAFSNAIFGEVLQNIYRSFGYQINEAETVDAISFIDDESLIIASNLEESTIIRIVNFLSNKQKTLNLTVSPISHMAVDQNNILWFSTRYNKAENKTILFKMATELGLINRGIYSNNLVGDFSQIINSADKKMIVAWSKDGSIYAYVNFTGSELEIPEPTKLQSKNPIRCLAIDPTNNQIWVGTEQQKVDVWSVASEKIIKTIPLELKNIDAIAFSPNGTKVGIASREKRNESKVIIWDIKKEKVVQEYFSIASPQENLSDESFISFVTEDIAILSSIMKNTIDIMNLTTQESTVLAVNKLSNNLVAVSPHGKRIAFLQFPGIFIIHDTREFQPFPLRLACLALYVSEASPEALKGNAKLAKAILDALELVKDVEDRKLIRRWFEEKIDLNLGTEEVKTLEPLSLARPE